MLESSPTGLLHSIVKSGLWKLYIFLTIYSIGLAITFPIVPTLITNGFASSTAGFALDCQLFTPADAPIACQDAHSQAVIWSSWTGFFSSSVLTVMCAPVVGALSDVHGRKPFMIIGVMLALVPMLIIMGNVHGLVSIYWYFPASALNGTVSAFTMCLTCVADLMEKRHRAPAVGFLLACFSIGILLGPGLGGTLPTQTAVLISVSATAITWFYLILVVPETAPGALARKAVRRDLREATRSKRTEGGDTSRGWGWTGEGLQKQDPEQQAVTDPEKAAVAVSRKDSMRESLLAGMQGSSSSCSSSMVSLASPGARHSGQGCAAVMEDGHEQSLIPHTQALSAEVGIGSGHKIPVAEAVAEALAAFEGPMGAAAVASSLHAPRPDPHADGHSSAPGVDSSSSNSTASTADVVVILVHSSNKAHTSLPGLASHALPAASCSPSFQPASTILLSPQGSELSPADLATSKPPNTQDQSSEQQHHALSPDPATSEKKLAVWRYLLADPWYRRVAFISVMQAIAFDGAQGMLIQYLQLTVGFNTQDQAKLFVVAAACGLFVKLAILPSLVKRVGEMNLLLIGLTAYVFQDIFLANVTTKTMALVAVASGAPAAFCYPAMIAIQTSRIDPRQFGAITGALQSITSLASGAGPLVFAAAFSAFTRSDSKLPYFPGVVWYMSATMAVAAMFVIATMGGKSHIAAAPDVAVAEQEGGSAGTEGTSGTSTSGRADVTAGGDTHSVFDAGVAAAAMGGEVAEGGERGSGGGVVLEGGGRVKGGFWLERWESAKELAGLQGRKSIGHTRSVERALPPRMESSSVKEHHDQE